MSIELWAIPFVLLFLSGLAMSSTLVFLEIAHLRQGKDQERLSRIPDSYDPLYDPVQESMWQQTMKEWDQKNQKEIARRKAEEKAITDKQRAFPEIDKVFEMDYEGKFHLKVKDRAFHDGREYWLLAKGIPIEGKSGEQ